VALLVDREKDLVQVPRIPRPGPPTSELIGRRLAELPAPLPDRFIGHEDPAGEQPLFHIPIAQAEAEAEPDAMADDLGRKPMVCVRVG